MAETGSDLISVVITCYNLERYIGEAIQSARGQIDAGSFEIIVVDDGSQDRSAAIIADFPDVRCIRMGDNRGVMPAMIRGVAEARGDIICLLDGDDIWEPGKLAAVRHAFAGHAALVTHDICFVDAKGDAIVRASRCGAVLGATPIADRPERVRRGIVEIDSYVWLGSALSFRRSAVDWDGFVGWVAETGAERMLYQDWPLAFWIASNPKAPCFYLDQMLMQYRLHAANHSGDTRSADRATRNFERAASTIAALAGLAERRAMPRPVLARLSAQAALLRASALAYAGRRGAAARVFAEAVGGLRLQHHPVRECAKLAIVLLFGPKWTTALKRFAAARRGD